MKGHSEQNVQWTLAEFTNFDKVCRIFYRSQWVPYLQFVNHSPTHYATATTESLLFAQASLGI
jgi:hypothetical protein